MVFNAEAQRRREAEMVRLGDVCYQVRGVSYKPQDSRDEMAVGYVPLLRANNIGENGINYDELIYVKCECVKDSQILRVGDLLVCASSGSRHLVGKAGKILLNRKDTFGAFCKVVRPDISKIDPDFLAQYFQSDYYRKTIASKAAGANINNIRSEHLDNLHLPLPSLSEQKRIAGVLDKISEMKRNVEARLKKLDLLVKARFSEMFGDCGERGMGKCWPCVTMGELATQPLANGFFAKRDDYNSNGNVCVLGVVNVVNRMYCKIVDLPKTNASDVDIKKYSVKWGDMLFCRSSLVKEGIGKASIVPRDASPNILFECHVIKLSLDLNRIDPIFAQVQSTRSYFRNQIIAHSKTATMTTISQSGISSAKMVIPPLPLQREFAGFVEKVEGLKAAAKKELEKVDLLYRAKLQEFFG